MFLWSFCLLSLFVGFAQLVPDLRRIPLSLGMKSEKARLQLVHARIQELEETFAAGLVPSRDRWETLRELPAPWGAVAHDSAQELRAAGSAVLPTLRRLRALVQGQIDTLIDAQARASQAMAQAISCGALVPVFGGALYFLLPGLEGQAWPWIAGCGLAFGLACAGAVWLLSIASATRWIGLPTHARHWVLAAQCASERFLALVRSGTPADLAWTRACALLLEEAPELAARWGGSIWQEPALSCCGESKGALRSLEDLGGAIRKAVQISLYEGKPCAERVEAALSGFGNEIRAHLERELSVLPTRALKPLFACVAPSLLGLLGFGLWLAWLSVSAEGA